MSVAPRVFVPLPLVMVTAVPEPDVVRPEMLLRLEDSGSESVAYAVASPVFVRVTL